MEKILDVLLEVLKDSPGNASLRKCDIEAAKAKLAQKPEAPAPAPASEQKPS